MNDTLFVLHPGVESLNAKAVTSTQVMSLESTTPSKLAPRLGNLKGKRVAILDNTKVNAIELMTAVVERLRPLGVSEVKSWRKHHASVSGGEFITDLMAWKPDLILTGLGD